LGDCWYWVVMEDFEPNREYELQLEGGMWRPCFGSDVVRTDAFGDARARLNIDCERGYLTRIKLSSTRWLNCANYNASCNDWFCWENGTVPRR
jgi:hypothetical protein